MRQFGEVQDAARLLDALLSAELRDARQEPIISRTAEATMDQTAVDCPKHCDEPPYRETRIRFAIGVSPMFGFGKAVSLICTLLLTSGYGADGVGQPRRPALADGAKNCAGREANPRGSSIAAGGGPAKSPPQKTSGVPVAAFPGAEGFGANTPRGRGGKIYVVKTLSWRGPDSLIEALYATAPRIIVFAVSGVIEVGKAPPLSEDNSYVTVAGQASPGGIMLAGEEPIGNYHTNFHDAVFRLIHLRGQGRYDNIRFNGAHDLIFDHCDFSGATDEAFDVTVGRNLTVQWSAITNRGPGGQQYGSLIAYALTTGISTHHNLYAHHAGRCLPHLYWTSLQQGVDPISQVDIRNNVIYNCSFSGALYNAGREGSCHELNLIGNVAKAGPDTPANAYLAQPGNAQLYAEDNVYEPVFPVLSPWSGHEPVDKPFPFPPVTTQPHAEAYELVLARAGAWPRDAMNVRTVREVHRGAGLLGNISDPLMTSGPEPPVDTDQDGMSDEWERAHGLNPARAGYAVADADGDGYTNVEQYVNELARRLVPRAGGGKGGGR